MQIAEAEAAMKAAMNEAMFARADEPRPFVPGLAALDSMDAVRGPDGVWVVEFEA